LKKGLGAPNDGGSGSSNLNDDSGKYRFDGFDF